MAFHRLFLIFFIIIAMVDSHKASWLNKQMPVDERVAALLAEMTIEEKTAQTIHLTGGIKVYLKSIALYNESIKKIANH